jgi:ribulose-5-phosphate 4-epimerase/fuculose-1-phosphate aldolase
MITATRALVVETKASMQEAEGVIKFSCEHEQRELSARVHGSLARELGAWRKLLAQSHLVGQDPNRYEGAGFGNLSGRLNPPSSPRGRRRFLISGTQTGGWDCRGLGWLCAVESYELRENSVRSLGPVLPSSESMTHASIYDLSPAIRYVFHVHSPQIWQQADRLRLPQTREAVAYGTQEMAEEVQRLYRESSLSQRRVLAMRGHEDGVIAFGHRARDAGLAILSELSEAYQMAEG